MSNLQHTDSEALVFRLAGIADIALIASMHARSWAHAYRGLLPDAYLDRDAESERAAHWRARMPELCAGAGSAFIAEIGGRAAGFVCVIEPDDARRVLVDNLHAMPEYKGRGIGSAMLDHAARWALGRGVREMVLSVLEGNRAAIGFYESRGWKKIAREADNVAGADVFSLLYTLAIA